MISARREDVRRDRGGERRDVSYSYMPTSRIHMKNSTNRRREGEVTFA